MEFENGKFFMLLFHFLRNVSEYALEVNICTFVVLVELSDFYVEVLSGVIEGKCCIEILFFFGWGTLNQISKQV